MTPSQVAKAANVQYGTARKWKTAYEKNPEEGIPLKKTNHINKSVSKLNEEHMTFIQNFFDENKTAVIQDAVESLTKNFEGLEIKKSRVAKCLNNLCNLFDLKLVKLFVKCGQFISPKLVKLASNIRPN